MKHKSSVIRVENLSKRYRLGGLRPLRDGLRHELHRMLTRPVSWIRRNGHLRSQATTDFWALRDMNFQIDQGEIVGVIGRNGAGKSTLLKLLSRITHPSVGQVHIKGRLASMLEVGTGFHPELTGRENIFLNGAVLGMSRTDIRSRFDEIVAFAGVEPFLETPVKHYSNGMYVRLAFAVAAHLNPEILVIDEVLAVGDSDFQKKCISKIDEVSRQWGRTVMVVSHQMPVIQNLCSRCLYLENGRLVGEGSTDEMVSLYESNSIQKTCKSLAEREDRGGIGKIRATRLFLENASGSEIATVFSGSLVRIGIDYELHTSRPVHDCVFCLEITKNLKKYFSLSSALVDRTRLNLPRSGTIRFSIPRWPLMGGRYQINLYIGSNGEMLDYLDSAAAIDVQDGDFYGTGLVCHEGWHGVSVMVDHSWELNPNCQQPAVSA